MKLIEWIKSLFKQKKEITNITTIQQSQFQEQSEVVKEVLDDGKFKVGDKVRITSSERGRKQRRCNYLYEGKIGELIHIWDLEKNPWGNYIVIMPKGFQNGFYYEELEVVES